VRATIAVGVDVVDVGRFARVLERWPRLAERVFTDGERETCAGSRNMPARLAARFAAKEATFKALGRGWPDLRYQDVAVELDRSGAPSISLGGRAAVLAGGRQSAVSIAHTEDLAIAEVILSAPEVA
jgi:holo-[acyl-carrier protein] synthase